MYPEDIRRTSAADVLEAGEPATRSADGMKVRRIPNDHLVGDLRAKLNLAGVDLDDAIANSFASTPDTNKPRFLKNSTGSFLELPESTLQELENTMNGVTPPKKISENSCNAHVVFWFASHRPIL
jgi:hypothetical protein